MLNTAQYLDKSQTVVIDGKDLMSHAGTYYISPPYAFVGYPNRNSVPFREFYNIPEATVVVRGTLRYQGFPEFIAALVKLGWLESGVKDWLVEGMEWKEVTKQAIGANSSDEA